MLQQSKSTWNSKWSSWAVPYLDKAFELGLITEQDTKFKLVGIPCTRGEMAKVITRAVEYLKEEPVADTSTYIAKLNDYDRMKEEYKPYVLQAYAKGILSGYDDGTFRDDGLLTRAEASSVLVRLIDKSERVNADETLYDYFGRKVTFTEPLRTDVPEQYQVSISTAYSQSRTLQLSISEVHAYNDPKQLPVPSYLTRKLKGQFQHACPSHLYSLIAETEKKQ